MGFGPDIGDRTFEGYVDEQITRFLEWCYREREEAQKSLEYYERGTMRFLANNVDLTEEQKASLRRVIEEMTKLIERVEADQKAAI